MQKNITVNRYSNGQITNLPDFVAIEEPLEISLTYSTEDSTIKKNISVTMRTPGNDAALATGFLFTEGIIKNNSAIKSTGILLSDENKMNVVLQVGEFPFLQQSERNFYTTSSCGVCGKASIDAIKTVSTFNAVQTNVSVAETVLTSLPQQLQQQQIIFKSTGGLHAAALFQSNGKFIMLKEDVGRHNALDKIVGAALQQDLLPLSNCILMLSGRASFELMQKATMAGIKIIAAIGAPSSLAVELAEEAGITLVGFLKKRSFNIYTHQERIILSEK